MGVLFPNIDFFEGDQCPSVVYQMLEVFEVAR